MEFKYDENNPLAISDSWAKQHTFKTIESTASSRLYKRKMPIVMPLQIFFPPYFTIALRLHSGMVTVTAWIKGPGYEIDVKSASINLFLRKKMLRNALNDLLTKLHQKNKMVH